jgi:hypothetical protein
MAKGLWVGIALGVFGLGAARFVGVPPPEATHFHANWAVFIDGERLDLSDQQYMEEISSCYSVDGEVTPQSRVHMHEGNHDVLHIHHLGATWGHLAGNLGIGLGEGYLILDDGTRIFDGEDGRFTYILNGRALTSVHNQLITSEDRLLISYGLESMKELGEERFGRVATTAGEYNTREDPATCTGTMEPIGMWGRLKLAFWG